ncbi:Heat shock factor protein [Leucoagaricus sp. SymC.cos]|nr:Heat shock factor protein [Leucoagaricus sp. SymC.cos]
MSSDNTVAVTRAPRISTNPQVPKNARQGVPAFLQKLYEMIDDFNGQGLIRWSEDGESFFILDHERFAREILGGWFKHQNFSSFVRQLNMYGFRKIPHLRQGVLRSESGDTEFWQFAHENFRRNQPDLMCLIHRKKVAAPAGAAGGQAIDVASILQGIAAIKRHQTTISEDLNQLKQSNQLLWQESMAARERLQKQDDTLTRIIRFLAGVFGNRRTEGGEHHSHAHGGNHREKDDVEERNQGAVIPVGAAQRRTSSRSTTSTGPKPRLMIEGAKHDKPAVETPISVPSPTPSLTRSDTAGPTVAEATPVLPNPNIDFYGSGPNDTVMQDASQSTNHSTNLSSTSTALDSPITPSRFTSSGSPTSLEVDPRIQMALASLTPEQLSAILNLSSQFDASSSSSSIDPNLGFAQDTTSSNQLTTFAGGNGGNGLTAPSPPPFDFSSLSGFSGLSPGLTSGFPALLSGSPSHPSSNTSGPVPENEHLLSFQDSGNTMVETTGAPTAISPRLERHWRDVQDVNNDVAESQSQINQLMEALGPLLGAGFATGTINDVNLNSVNAMNANSTIGGNTPSSNVSAGNASPGTTSTSRVSSAEDISALDPSHLSIPTGLEHADFDFDSFFQHNPATTTTTTTSSSGPSSNNPSSTNAGIIDSTMDSMNFDMPGYTDLSGPETAFLDEVPTSPITSTTTTRSPGSPNTRTTTRSNTATPSRVGRKRKSDVMAMGELEGALQGVTSNAGPSSGDGATGPGAGAKVKRRKD